MLFNHNRIAELFRNISAIYQIPIEGRDALIYGFSKYWSTRHVVDEWMMRRHIRVKLGVPEEADHRRLEGEIILHRSQRADDRCVEDDIRLHAALGDGVEADYRVGDKFAMLVNCARYIDKRCLGGAWKTYVQLEEENLVLRQDVSALEERLREYEERHMIKYEGTRTSAQGRRVTREDTTSKRTFTSPLLDWGKLNTQPGLLARTLLADHGLGEEEIFERAEAFDREVVSGLADNWLLTSEDIHAWLRLARIAERDSVSSPDEPVSAGLDIDPPFNAMTLDPTGLTGADIFQAPQPEAPPASEPVGGQEPGDFGGGGAGGDFSSPDPDPVSSSVDSSPDFSID